jgi:hypothetical protein
VTSHGRSLEDLASELLSSYLLATGWTNSNVASRPSKKLRAAVLDVARELLSAGRSPVGYVEYVVTRYQARNGGKFPFATQVFGPVAIEGWLPEYATHARAVLETSTYRASDERRAAYYAYDAACAVRRDLAWRKCYPNNPFPWKPYAAPAPLRDRKREDDR